METQLSLIERKLKDINLQQPRNSTESSTTQNDKYLFHLNKHNIKINGWPYSTVENVINVFDELCSLINCRVDIWDVSDIFRIGQTETIILEFTSKMIRRTVFNKYIEYVKAARAKDTKYPEGVLLK